MKLDADDDGFIADLRAWLASLPQEVIRSFDKVLAESPGYYPTTLHEAWLAEVRARQLEPVESNPSLANLVDMPVGHALDFDWRFADESRASLLVRLERLTRAGDRIAFLGTPTLFVDAFGVLPDRDHILVDANAAMVERVQQRLGSTAAMHARIGFDLIPSELKVSVCVLDPPWYPEDTRAFLFAASQMLQVGGIVLLSQPPLSARPGVAAERAEFELRLGELGLRINRTEAGAISYQTPHFERMSLMAASPSLSIPEVWRRGDLMQLVKESDVALVWSPSLVDVSDWVEVHFGPVRVRLRNAGGADLELIAPDIDRLLTVSRRDPLRERVGFWTSGNRVRSLSDVKGIGELIAMCDASLGLLNFTHKKVLEFAETIGIDARVAHDLGDLLLLEYQEHVAGRFGVAE